MSKELEALEQVKTLRGFNDIELGNDKNITKSLDIIEQALHRLESIDNANPSEALECLEDIYRNAVFISDYDVFGKQHPTNISPETNKSISVQCDTIKQALLKAQEPKHYLKWEDLKFPYSVWKNDEVVLNGEKIGMRYKSDYGFMDCDYKVVKIYNLKTGKSICKIYDKDKDFFNSLHLEWAKECSNCKKQHTNGCPNSSECYSKKDKPHWERVEE